MKHVTAGLALAFAVTALGCGGSQKPKTAAAPTCADAAATAQKLFEASADGTPEQATIIREVFAERCPADAWSPAIIACFAGATTDADASTCTKKLSRAQVDAIGDALMRRMGEQMNREDAAKKSDDPCAH